MKSNLNRTILTCPERDSILHPNDAVWNNKYNAAAGHLLALANTGWKKRPSDDERFFIWWSIGDLNPWPRHCQCRALPAALMPHGMWFDIKQKFVFYNMYDGHGIHSCMREHERCQPMQTKNLFDETKWWTWRDSNSLPLRCERSALPGELQARMYEKTGRLQVPTSK